MNAPSVQRRPFYRLILVCLMPACILALLLLALSSERHSVRATGPTYISGGSITGTVTWTRDGSPYIVQGDITIQSTGTLTVEPGVEVRFEAGTGLEVSGHLVAIGTVTQPITFTSNLTSPAPGDWWGLRFRSGSDGHLAWCDLSYGGMNPFMTSLEIDPSGDVEVEHCRIHHSGSSGLMSGGSVQLMDVRLDNNQKQGISLKGGSAWLKDTRVENNQGHGVFLWGTDLQTTLELENVYIAHNQGAAVWQKTQVPLPVYRNLTVTGNLTDAIAIGGGATGHGTVWDFRLAGVPIQIHGSIHVNAPLLIGPGTELRFITNTDLLVGDELYALGTPTAPITFTGLHPRPGTWRGISVQSPGIAVFNNCDLGYGGVSFDQWGHGSPVPLLEIASEEVIVQNCRIHHSAGDGIRAISGTVIAFSQIYSNVRVYTDTFGLRALEDEKPVVAHHNWWGHPSGPYHPALNPGGLGEPITGNILFSPWLTNTGEAGPAPIVARFVLDVSGPDRVNPGGDATYVVFYSNLTTRTITTPIVMQLPYPVNLVESTGDGIYWPERGQVFWRQELPPGSTGFYTVRVQYDWGLPFGLRNTVAAFLADPSISGPYLAYTPTRIASQVPLSDAEFEALRQNNPDFALLYTRAITAGMRFAIAERLTLSDGRIITQAMLIHPVRSAVVFVRDYGPWTSSSWFDEHAFTIMDAHGEATLDYDQGTWSTQGDWGPRGNQSCQQPSYEECVANCILDNAKWWLLSRISKIAKAILSGVDCVKCVGGNDKSACIKCANAVGRAVPFAGELMDVWDCMEECKRKSSSRLCTPGSQLRMCNWILFVGDSVVTYICNSSCMYELSSVTPCPEGKVCIFGECIGCQLSGEEMICEDSEEEMICEDSEIGPGAHDPNAKYGPSGDLLPGQRVTYTITYENEGQGTAYGVYIMDTLSEHFDETTLQIFGDGDYITPTRTLFWYIGEVAPQGQPNSSGVVTFSARLKPNLPGGTVIVNQAVVHFPSVPEKTPTNPTINIIAPVSAEPQTVHTGAQQPVTITLRGRDVGNAPLTYTLVSEPLYGAWSSVLPTLIYTPMENFVGVDRFSFRVSNGITESRPAEVTIFVDPSAADTTPPQVRWTEPASGTVGIQPTLAYTDTLGPAYAPFVYIQFSEAMSPTTITSQTVQLLDDRGRPVSATLTYDGVIRQVRLIPREPLRRPGVYTGRVSASVADASGNPLGRDHTWRFWTEMYRLYLPVVLRNR